MNLDLAENTNKLILLVVAAVALLLALNTYQHQLGKNLAVVLSIITIVVVGYVGFSLMNEKPSMNSNNVVPINNLVNNTANNMVANNAANNMVANNAANNMVANNAANNMVANNAANNMVANNAANNAANNMVANNADNNMVEGFQGSESNNRNSRENTSSPEEEDIETFQNQTQNNNAGESSRLNVETSNNPVDSGILNCANLLPADTNSIWAQVSPSGVGELCTKNLLNAGHHVGVNTQGNSLRNANRDLRSQPPNPQVPVSPWLNTTIGPDLLRKPLE
jgi:hypothetical protein